MKTERDDMRVLLDKVSRIEQKMNSMEELLRILIANQYLDNIDVQNVANSRPGPGQPAKKQSPLEQAESLFFSKQTIEASIPLFKKLQRDGNGRACYFLGVSYQYGYGGLPKSPRWRGTYIKKGIERGDALCQLHFIADHWKKSASKKNHAKFPEISSELKRLVSEVEKEAAGGNLAAMDELGYFFCCVPFFPHSKQEGKCLLTTAKKNRYWRAVEHLAMISSKRKK